MNDKGYNLPESCRNISLFWDKYSFLKFKKDFSEKKSAGIVYEILDIMNKNLNGLNESIECLKERRNSLQEKLKNQIIIDTNLRVKGRLLVGGGLPSITEVGMIFSRNYGLPVIPGSALKGCFSHYCKEKGIFNGREFKLVFGEDTSQQDEHIRGALLFLDAFPVKDLKFGLDVVNNHFQMYYSEGKIPNDWYNPVPVTYITVVGGVFKFTVVAVQEVDDNLKERIKKAFEEMLISYGIGAKTNYGYGRFEKNDQK